MSAAAVAQLRSVKAIQPEDRPYVDPELKEFVARKAKELRWGKAEILQMILVDIRHMAGQVRVNFDEIDAAVGDALRGGV